MASIVAGRDNQDYLSQNHLIIIFLKKLLCKTKIDVIFVSAPKKEAL